MDFRLALSLHLLELCRRQNLTLGQLAAAAGVPVSTLKNIVDGHSRNPGVLTLQALCEGLGVDLSEFVAEIEKMADI